MTIEERLDHLEKANRRWRTFAVSLSLVLAMGLFMAQGPGQIIPDVIRAKKIEVIGKNGSPVVSLSSWDRGGRIHAMTNSGKMLFESTAGEISVYNSNGQKLVKLSATKEGEGLLATYNHKGEGCRRDRCYQRGRRRPGDLQRRRAKTCYHHRSGQRRRNQRMEHHRRSHMHRTGRPRR